ncbi:MAG: GIY-YIG nuclease family protein [Candidatus Pacebacteria bacterium]|nr:GIY-YIG nuclease family protein [Candidatus Paceibacterota bacterium]
MKKEDLVKNILPGSPGVYFFLGKHKEILYIGKATSLAQRIKSYFDDNIAEKRSVLIEKMVDDARTVEWTATDSVLEAMLLEVNLIRTHRPYFNTRSKDDKSYNNLVITNEEFPRVLVVRSKDLSDKYTANEFKYIFGPFPNGTLFRAALKIVRKLFQFYDTSKPLNKIRSKMANGQVDFNRQIGLYPEVQSRIQYNRTIRHIRLFFEGKKEQIIKELEKAMMKAAKSEKFEIAAVHKKKIFALKHIQDVALVTDDKKLYQDSKNFRIEAYDVAHLSGGSMVSAMTVCIGGELEKASYRKFIITTCDGPNDPKALSETLERRLAHNEWSLPNLIVVDGNTIQTNVAERLLKKLSHNIPVVGVVKDEKHKPKNILGSRKLIAEHKDSILLTNAEAHRFAIAFHRKKRKI